MVWSTLSRVGNALEVLADVLFPALCHSCGALLPRGVRMVCPACVETIRRVEPDDRQLSLARERLCSDGLVDDVVTVFHFEKGGTLQSILHQLKYAGASGLGDWLGGHIGCALCGNPSSRAWDVIVPVPLHIGKKRERGYNQSACIARGIGRMLHIPIDARSLKRTRYTSTQTALGIEERKINMTGAFCVPAKRVPALDGKRILLVDDVITTGATIRSCAAALRDSGVRSILVCSAALADRTNL